MAGQFISNYPCGGFEEYVHGRVLRAYMAVSLHHSVQVTKGRQLGVIRSARSASGTAWLSGDCTQTNVSGPESVKCQDLPATIRSRGVPQAASCNARSSASSVSYEARSSSVKLSGGTSPGAPFADLGVAKNCAYANMRSRWGTSARFCSPTRRSWLQTAVDLRRAPCRVHPGSACCSPTALGATVAGGRPVGDVPEKAA